MQGLNRPSLLERLIDDRFTAETAHVEEWALTVQQHERSVVTDLNDLVNTARPDEQSLPAEFVELRNSIYCYGLSRPGLLGKSAEDRQRVRQELDQAIRRFEPRLRRVRIEDAEVPKEKSADTNILPYDFKISAELRVDPLPENVLLDATLTRYPQTIRIVPGQAAEEQQGEADRG